MEIRIKKATLSAWPFFVDMIVAQDAGIGFDRSNRNGGAGEPRGKTGLGTGVSAAPLHDLAYGGAFDRDLCLQFLEPRFSDARHHDDAQKLSGSLQ